jgi:hypothetical protein
MSDVTFGIPGVSIAVSSGSIEAAVNALNRAWERPEQIYRATASDRVAFFTYEPGDNLEFFMRIDGQSDEDKGDIETRNFGETQGVKVARVGFNRVDLMAERIPLYTNRDPRQIFLNPTEEAMYKTVRLPTRRMALLLRQGLTKTCLYDGRPFYSEEHVINPLDKTAGTPWPNYFPGINVTEDGWASIIDQIEQIPGANDYLINEGFLEAGPEIWVPNRKLAKKFGKIFDPNGLIAVEPTAGVNAASETTYFKNGAKVVVVPELINQSDPASQKRYFIFNAKYKTRRAVVVRIPRAPIWKMMKGANNPLEHSNNAYPVWADMDFGIDFGLPHLSYLGEEE